MYIFFRDKHLPNHPTGLPLDSRKRTQGTPSPHQPPHHPSNTPQLLILTQGRYLTSEDYERLVTVFPGTYSSLLILGTSERLTHTHRHQPQRRQDPRLASARRTAQSVRAAGMAASRGRGRPFRWKAEKGDGPGRGGGDAEQEAEGEKG